MRLSKLHSGSSVAVRTGRGMIRTLKAYLFQSMYFISPLNLPMAFKLPFQIKQPFCVGPQLMCRSLCPRRAARVGANTRTRRLQP